MISDPTLLVNSEMKIGIYLGSYSPECGGGYVFEREIFREILQYRANAYNWLLVFPVDWYDETLAEDATAVGIPHIKLQQPECAFRDRVKLWRNRITASGNFYNWYENAITTQLHSADIDVMWYVGWGHLTSEIPSFVNIWDLQHRLQPYFPEVSAGGEWARREERYSIALKRAAGVVIPNERAAEELKRFYGIADERIHLLPHPTPSHALTDLEPVDVSKWVQPDSINLLYPAQFWPHKNHYNALSAIRILKEENLHVRLILSGGSTEKHSRILKFVQDMKLEDCIVFAGYVRMEELHSLYKQVTALLFPSLFGPENLPPLEAFALGCPVIASRVEGSEYQLKEAALLFDPLDPADMADKIKQVSSNKGLRDSLIEKGKSRASYTSADFVTDMCLAFKRFSNLARNWS